MTYILGFKRSGVNFIISDTLVSWIKNGKVAKSEKIGLKTGSLYPGCLFGRSGNMLHSNEFIVSAKEELHGKKISHPVDAWHHFEDYIASYNFPIESETHFEILFSVWLGTSASFYLLDSHKGLRYCHENWKSIGSGKKLLDPVYENINEILDQAIEKMTSMDKAVQVDVFGYITCLKLTELAQTYDKYELEKHGTGGAFHFVAHTEGRDFAQLPSVYILGDVNPSSSRIYLWLYRICYVEGGLVSETYIPPNQLKSDPNGKMERTVLFDSSARLEIKELILDKGFRDSVIKKSDDLPFYFFCGFGFVNRKYRSHFGWHIAEPNAEIVITREGDIAPFFADDILSVFSKHNELKPPYTLLFTNSAWRKDE